MQTIIKITDLYKIYNETAQEVRAVDGVSLEFEQGEFTAMDLQVQAKLRC
jgi:ABC-type lipoprotein export system ATPase subunit